MLEHNYQQLYYTFLNLTSVTILTTLYYFSSIKNGLISFISFSDMHQSHHLVGCHATGILCLFLFKCFALFKFVAPSHKFNMNNSFRVIFIRINIINVDIIKIYIEKNYFITRKCDITRIFIKKYYIIISEYNIIEFLIIFS